MGTRFPFSCQAGASPLPEKPAQKAHAGNTRFRLSATYLVDAVAQTSLDTEI
jgi:hypothetical protein